MNYEMAYFLGMIVGNGEIKRGMTSTTISISIPHKKLETEDSQDVKVYIKASIQDIRSIIDPLSSTSLDFIQQKSETILSLRKGNEDFLIREVNHYCNNQVRHESMRVPEYFFVAPKDEVISFLRGFSDVTGYIRRSNYAFKQHMHRVYLEIPHNWDLVIDIANLLKYIGIPVHTIDWGHPNMRDPEAKKYRDGKPNFWKKEHQIKILANEFLPVGFGVIHKRQSLQLFANELAEYYRNEGKKAEDYTSKFYWEKSRRNKKKEIHPSENDAFIPESIRGKHFDSWQDIAIELGYHQ